MEKEYKRKKVVDLKMWDYVSSFDVLLDTGI